MRKQIRIKRLDLSYYEVNENANRTLFFIHGNSGSARMWDKQLESEKLQPFRMIAIDLPGHGESGKSNDPDTDYSPLGTGEIIDQVIQNLSNNKPFIVIGCSYGSNVAAETLLYQENPAGVCLFGSCVIGDGIGLDKVFLASEEPFIFSYNEKNTETVSNFISKAMPAANPKDIQQAIEDYMKVDDAFKPSLFKTFGEGKISDEINLLKQLQRPLLVVFGKNDTLINNGYLDQKPFITWNDTIYKLEHAGHWANIENPEAFNQLLYDYSMEIFN